MSSAFGTRLSPILTVEGLSVRYGSTQLLRDVDLAVNAGEVLALLGPNGAGKTTLMRAIAGLAEATAGTIRFSGDDITSTAVYRRARAGLCLVPEGRGVFPNLTVRENLRLQGSPRQRAEVVERVVTTFPALRDRLEVPAGRLSGGQQQMLAIGRSFVSDPSIVLLDEVSMGLAPIVVDEIFEALQTLARTGVALLIVEQYVSKALSLADRVSILTRGSVRWHGSPGDISEDEILRNYLAVDVPVGH